MIKKAVIAGLILMVGIPILAANSGPGPKIRQGAKTSWNWFASLFVTPEEEKPLDQRIENARKAVAELGPDIRKCMHMIAEQQVDVEQLQKRIADRKRELQTQEAALLKLRNDLKTGETSFVYAGQSYKASEVRRDLALRFDRYQTFAESLKRDDKIVQAKIKALKANERRLEEMLAAKKELEVKVEQLEARWKTLQAAETSSDLEFDDSKLGEVKKTIRKLNKELDVRDKLLTSSGKLSGLIPVDQKPREIPVDEDNITKKIDEFFGQRDLVRNNGKPVTTAQK